MQAATNGIEFAKSKEFCKKAFEAGMRYAYLQFDGIGNDANSHRQVGNLFDVKLRAIENMHEAGIEIVLVTTIVNNVNNDQVGPIVKFAMENPEENRLRFVPAGFVHRPRRGHHSRAPHAPALHAFAPGAGRQRAGGQNRADARLVPAFVYFARSPASPTWSHGPDAQWGALSCGCHPNCGVGTAMMINKETKEWAPISRFLNAPQLVKDVSAITDAARGKKFSAFMMALALLKNYNPFQAPPSLRLKDIWKKFDKTWAVSKDSDKKVRPHQPTAPTKTP